MECSECGYPLPADTECPRCQYRNAVRASAVADPAPEEHPAATVGLLTPTVHEDMDGDLPLPPPRAAAPPTRRWAWAVPAVAVCALIVAWYLHERALTPTEQKIAAIFASSDAPCRAGLAAPCMTSIKQIRQLHDMPDASLLLGDYKVARYLQTMPAAAVLSQRWRSNTITEPELLSMGDVAYAKNLSVCRSFWMYAQIKRDHVAVPQFVIGGAAP